MFRFYVPILVIKGGLSDTILVREFKSQQNDLYKFRKFGKSYFHLWLYASIIYAHIAYRITLKLLLFEIIHLDSIMITTFLS